MKTINKIKLFIMTVGVMLTMQSCSDDENVMIEAPENVSAQAGFGSVIFNWDFPKAENVVYVRVDYIDVNGNPKHQKFSVQNESPTILGLEKITYDFTVTAGDKDGNLSEAVVLSLTPDNPPYLVVASTLNLRATVGGVIATWQNPTGEEIGINIVYTDKNGNEATFVTNSSDQEGSAILSGVSAGEQIFEAYVTNSSGSQSESKFYTLTPSGEIKLDRSAWTAEVDSFFKDSQKGAQALDGNTGTFWQTHWQEGIPYPHWILIDMQQDNIISKVVLYNRNHAGNLPKTFKKFKLEGSLDNETWMDLGEFETEATLDPQSFILESPHMARYIRATFLESFTDEKSMALAEFEVYGAAK